LPPSRLGLEGCGRPAHWRRGSTTDGSEIKLEVLAVRGVLFQKQWIFDQGGRPVIYQPGTEYDLLPDELKWRHVCYEPPAVDFTWERECRVHCAELCFDPGVACLVLPSEDYLGALIADRDEYQDAKWYQYSEVFDQEELMQYREDFPWRIIYVGG